MNKKLHVLLVLFLILSVVIPVVKPTSTVKAAETRDLVILGTTDIHGNVDNYDYFSDSAPGSTSSSRRGLTKVQTYVKNALAANPNTILIDDGDTIQGTPLAYYFDVLDTSKVNPLAASMNAMGYVAATVGNHEFNYGPGVFNKFQKEAAFPMLSANVTGCRDYSFQPYVIKDMGGVQVGILGLTPPAVVHWERPENIVDCVFGDAMDAANKYVPEMRAAGADVIVVAAHTGLDETYGYGREENFAKILANEVPGIDVILAGHAHALVASQTVNGVLITEPYYWARNIADIRITVSGADNDWTVLTKTATAPAVAALAEDPGLVAITAPYHATTVNYINTPIGTTTAAFPGGPAARVQDSPLPDLINRVQMDAAAAAGFPVDASLAALFNDSGLPAGQIKLKDAYGIYIYDNTLYVVEATGQMVKDELEWTAGYFNQYSLDPAGPTTSASMPAYNYDMWSGIDYKLDLTKPVGQRVVDLKLHGQPLAMDQIVRVAMNNYRATGKFPAAPKLYQSTTEVRELITLWIKSHGTVAPGSVFVQNYSLLPAANLWMNPTGKVTRSDYAGLLSTAFNGSSENYLPLPSDKGKPGVDVPREGAFFLLSNKAMEGLKEIGTDMSVLNAYSDSKQMSSWSKEATAYALQAGIFMPTGGKILPKQLVTNTEALTWVREARFPLYTFLSTNDFHGQLETGKLVNKQLVGGAAYDMTYINTYKALNPLGTVLLDGGDIMQGTPISNLLNGASTIDAYNKMGYKASVVGNHEFDWGLTGLQARMAQAKFPILLANVFNTGTDIRPTWTKPTTMFTVKG
jgi:2',3'-cyclic-nucleotide 2'-phosphodiesterase / 3'-nucleotidase